ncbi:hypothetical protein RFI_27906 [Reticulomyxa filosa]|uniref:Uncharacterized protein n=1 Tax=Reticulomyxa filosa TaxID=46433 RepID=X6M8X3_RETFI|nr:hypothetical protein RFI_27906 [Reticulomyxa filosa]|eukprot:ETO09470.1 hypothetical protein RFI_27906 [Reticulomyxa filosa]
MKKTPVLKTCGNVKSEEYENFKKSPQILYDFFEDINCIIYFDESKLQLTKNHKTQQIISFYAFMHLFLTSFDNPIFVYRATTIKIFCKNNFLNVLYKHIFCYHFKKCLILLLYHKKFYCKNILFKIKSVIYVHEIVHKFILFINITHLKKHIKSKSLKCNCYFRPIKINKIFIFIYIAVPKN